MMFVDAKRQRKISSYAKNRRKFRVLLMIRLSIKMQIRGMFGMNNASTNSVLSDKESSLLIKLGYSINVDKFYGKTVISW